MILLWFVLRNLLIRKRITRKKRPRHTRRNDTSGHAPSHPYHLLRNQVSVWRDFLLLCCARMYSRRMSRNSRTRFTSNNPLECNIRQTKKSHFRVKVVKSGIACQLKCASYQTQIDNQYSKFPVVVKFPFFLNHALSAKFTLTIVKIYRCSCKLYGIGIFCS